MRSAVVRVETFNGTGFQPRLVAVFSVKVAAILDLGLRSIGRGGIGNDGLGGPDVLLLIFSGRPLLSGFLERVGVL